MDRSRYRFATKIAKPWKWGGDEHQPADIENIRESLASAIDLDKQTSSDTVWFVTNTDQDLDIVLTYAEVLGDETIEAMQTEDGASVDGIRLRHVLAADLETRNVSGAILALYPTQETLDRLDALRQPHGVVVVPYMDHPGSWNDKWSAVPI